MLFLLLPSPSLLSYPIHRPSPGFGHFAADVVLLVELVAAITRTLRVSSAPSETVREEPARLHWARQGKVEGGEMRSRCPGRICRGLFSLAGEIMLTIDFGRLVADSHCCLTSRLCHLAHTILARRGVRCSTRGDDCSQGAHQDHPRYPASDRSAGNHFT